MNRKELLKKLINMEGNIDDLLKALEKFGWDSSDELINLKKENVLHVLQLFLQRKLTENEVEVWANAIECREDIGREKNSDGFLEEVIHELANPYLTKVLSRTRAENLSKKLEKRNYP